MDTTTVSTITTSSENIMEILAIVIGPIIAVLISVWLQRRHQKRDGKLSVFYTLMAYRKSYPPAKDLVKALNLIDVVYADEAKITQLWHRYYDLLCETGARRELREHAYLELLSAIAIHLGFRKLQQTDIDKFYTPQAHVDATESDFELDKELIRVLKNTARFALEPIKPELPKKDE